MKPKAKASKPPSRKTKVTIEDVWAARDALDRAIDAHGDPELELQHGKEGMLAFMARENPERFEAMMLAGAGAPVQDNESGRRRIVLNVVRRALKENVERTAVERAFFLRSELHVSGADPEHFGKAFEVTEQAARLYFESKRGAYYVTAHILLTAGACGVRKVENPKGQIATVKKSLRDAAYEDRKRLIIKD